MDGLLTAAFPRLHIWHRHIYSRILLIDPEKELAMLKLFFLLLLLAASLTPTATIAQASEPKSPLAALEPFAGIWKIDRPPHDGISDEYRVLEWDLKKTVLVLSEHQRKDAAFRRYVMGLTAWNPLTQRIEFQEHADWGNFNRGEIEVLGTGQVRRHLYVHYAAGAALHWRETWMLDANGENYTTTVEKLESGQWKEGLKPFVSVRVASLPKA
jgi:hypothetical protein